MRRLHCYDWLCQCFNSQKMWCCKRVCSNTRGVNCTVCWTHRDVRTINIYIVWYRKCFTAYGSTSRVTSTRRGVPVIHHSAEMRIFRLIVLKNWCLEISLNFKRKEKALIILGCRAELWIQWPDILVSRKRFQHFCVFFILIPDSVTPVLISPQSCSCAWFHLAIIEHFSKQRWADVVHA